MSSKIAQIDARFSLPRKFTLRENVIEEDSDAPPRRATATSALISQSNKLYVTSSSIGLSFTRDVQFHCCRMDFLVSLRYPRNTTVFVCPYGCKQVEI